MKKKLVCLLLCLVVVFGLLTISAVAEGEEEFLIQTYRNNSGTLSLNEGDPSPLADRNHSPNSITWFKLYYGVPRSGVYTELTGGTLTSDNESVLTATYTTEYNEACYEIETHAFGEANLTYTDPDGTTYTQKVTVSLPGNGFYTAQERTEANWLQRPVYQQETGNTIWFIREVGFHEEEVQNLSVTVDGETFGTAEKVLREGTEDDPRYDIKIGFPAGKAFTSKRPEFRLKYGTSTRNDSLQVVKAPALMYRSMRSNSGGWYEDMSRDLNSFDRELAMTHSWSLRPYYGREDDAVPLDVINGEMVSADPTILEVTKTTKRSQDGNPYFELRGVSVGTTTVRYTDGNVRYEAQVTVGLPPEAFYSSQERSPETLLQPIDTSKLENNIVWCLAENGFTEAELDNTTVLLDEENIGFERVARQDGNYDIKIVLTDYSVNGNSQLEVQRQEDWGLYYVASSSISTFGDQSKKAAYFGDYIIGFAFEMADDVFQFNENNWVLGNQSTGEPGERFWKFRTAMVAACTKEVDEAGGAVYLIDPAITEQLTVKRIWIQPTAGANDTFSFSQSAVEQELTGDELQTHMDIFMKENTEGAAILHMDVELELNGETKEAIVSIGMFQQVDEIHNWDRTLVEDESVEKLNADLAEYAKNLKKDTQYILTLAEEYIGTIEIPAAFDGRDSDFFIHGAPNGTKIRGRMNLNTANFSAINGVHFIGDGTGAGLYGGSVANVDYCTFQNYDCAVDARKGMICMAHGNVLINNNIGYVLHRGMAVANGSNASGWMNNTFINNGIAVKFLGFDDHISPYRLRIYESNFFGNGVDFDIQTNATLYFYRNYFANWNTSRKNINLHALSNANTHSAVFNCLTPRQPIVTAGENVNAKVNSNPRWFYPVKNWWRCTADIVDIFGEDYDCLESARSPVEGLSMLSDETADQPGDTTMELPYENYLTADWDLETNILNDEAGQLLLDAAAFEAEGEKCIDVLNAQEKSIGTWSFTEKEQLNLFAEETAPAKFNASLKLTWDGEDLLVTVSDSAVLSRVAAMLTIPCGNVTWDGAQVTDPDGSVLGTVWNAQTKSVTFPVTAGGTYRIEKASVMVADHNAAAHTMQIDVAARYSGTVLLASYTDEGKFLSVAPGNVKEPLTYHADADYVQIFLVSDMTAMLPQTAMVNWPVN